MHGEPVVVRKDLRVLLGSEFARTVRPIGIVRSGVFVARRIEGLSVDAGRRGVDDARDAGGPRRFEHVDRADEIRPHVVERIFQTFRDLELGRLMRKDIFPRAAAPSASVLRTSPSTISTSSTTAPRFSRKPLEKLSKTVTR